MEQKPSYLKSLKKESVVQGVINRLTEAISAGELKPGDKIPTEIELAESFGVARSSIREAIKILTYLGVLESKRSEGTFICDGYQESMIDPMVYGIILNRDSFEDLMELREMVEAGTMQIAIRNHKAADIAELEQILDEMQATLKGNDEDCVKPFFAADERFHDKIAEMGNNPIVVKIDKVVRTLTYAMRFETVSSMITNGRGQKLLDTHRVLLDVIRQGDDEDLSSKVRESYFEAELRERR